MRQDIEVVGIRHINRGRLKAYIDVRFGDLIVREFALIDGPGQQPFIGVPRKSWVEDGQRYYVPIVEFRNGLREQVRDLILGRWAEEGKHVHEKITPTRMER